MAQKPVIRVGHLKITDHLILGVTKSKLENGEETFNNFSLETKVYPGWNPLAIDLRTGAIEAACILAPIAMELFHSGIKLKLILQTHKNGSVIIKNKRANIKTVEDFKGKTVLIPHYLSVHHLLFNRLLRESGIPIGVNDVKFEVVAPSEIPEIMEWDEDGKVAGFIVAEPFGSQVVKAGFGEEFKLSKDIWANHPCCVLAIREETLKNNPEAVEELTTSFVKSGLFITQNPKAASEIGSKFLNQDVSLIEQILTTDRVSFDELFPVAKNYEFIQIYLTTHIKAMSGKINLDNFIDTRFADKAGAH